MSDLHKSSFGFCLPSQRILDDLIAKFVLNASEEERASDKCMFLVEKAHWFYEDNLLEDDPTLKSMSLKEFTRLLFNNCDVFKPYATRIDKIVKNFASYKRRIPVNGAIILDDTYERFLLVKGWRGSLWTFPGGKLNSGEENHDCAIREVLEETGFDVSNLLKKEDYIDIENNHRKIRQYIVVGVTDDTAFAPLAKKEISEIAWQRLDDLQPASNDMINHEVAGLKLHMVAPFYKDLKGWISKHPSPVAKRHDKPARSVWKAKTSGRWNMAPRQEFDDPQDTEPAYSFTNFKFSISKIKQAIESDIKGMTSQTPDK